VSKSGTDSKVGGTELRPGETFLLVGHPAIVRVWPKYLLTVGLYGFWRSRDTTVLTDQRVIMGKGIVSRSERAIPMRRIQDASYARRGLTAYCEVKYEAQGRYQVARLGPFNRKTARRFAREIDSRT
jgi:Bacterial PH domain